MEVLTELPAGVWQKDRYNGWHLNLAPTPAVATDPVHRAARGKDYTVLEKTVVKQLITDESLMKRGM